MLVVTYTIHYCTLCDGDDEWTKVNVMKRKMMWFGGSRNKIQFICQWLKDLICRYGLVCLPPTYTTKWHIPKKK